MFSKLFDKHIIADHRLLQQKKQDKTNYFTKNTLYVRLIYLVFVSKRRQRCFSLFYFVKM